MNEEVLQAMIDEVFAAAEAAEPAITPVLAMVNGLIDEYGLPAILSLLTSYGIDASSTPQELIDGLFQALETKVSGIPFAASALAVLDKAIDAALVLIPSK